MSTQASDLRSIFFAFVLVLINEFFAVAGFGLANFGEGRLDERVHKQRLFAMHLRFPYGTFGFEPQ